MENKVTVVEFVKEFKDKKITNTKFTPNAIEDFINEKLEITPYISFTDKRKIAEMVIDQNITDEYSVKKINSTSEFIGFIIAMLATHTNLDFSTNVIEDYDMLSESGLLEYIFATFKKDYDECKAVLKMVRSDVLADNSLNVVVAKFLDGISEKLDGVSDTIKGIVEKIDLDKFTSLGLNEKEMDGLKKLLNKFSK